MRAQSFWIFLCLQTIVTYSNYSPLAPALPWANGCSRLSGFWILGFRCCWSQDLRDRLQSTVHQENPLFACGFISCRLDNRTIFVRLARPKQKSSLVHQSAAPFDRGSCTKCIHFLGHFHPIRSWSYGMERPPQGNMLFCAMLVQNWARLVIQLHRKNNKSWANRWSMSSFKQHQTFLGFHIARSTWRSWAAKSRRMSPRLPRCRNGIQVPVRWTWHICLGDPGLSATFYPSFF